MAIDRRRGEVSIHIEDPGLSTVQQILAMTVEELHYELQARHLVPDGTAKPDLQHAPLPSRWAFASI